MPGWPPLTPRRWALLRPAATIVEEAGYHLAGCQQRTPAITRPVLAKAQEVGPRQTGSRCRPGRRTSTRLVATLLKEAGHCEACCLQRNPAIDRLVPANAQEVGHCRARRYQERLALSSPPGEVGRCQAGRLRQLGGGPSSGRRPPSLRRQAITWPAANRGGRLTPCRPPPTPRR